MHALWYRFVGLELEGRVIAVTTLVIVLAVAFVSHVYETVFLIRQRERDLLAAERLDRARAQAELLYILTNREPDLVPLADELHFAEGYVELLQVRFGDAVLWRREGEVDVPSLLIPPCGRGRTGPQT